MFLIRKRVILYLLIKLNFVCFLVCFCYYDSYSYPFFLNQKINFLILICISHIRNSDGCFLVFDLTSYKSFDNLDYWIDSIKSSTSENIMIYLMGNKADLIIKNESNRKVSIEQVAQFKNANSCNIIEYFECSAKTKYNLVEPFEKMCKGNLTLFNFS